MTIVICKREVMAIRARWVLNGSVRFAATPHRPSGGRVWVLASLRGQFFTDHSLSHA